MNYSTLPKLQILPANREQENKEGRDSNPRLKSQFKFLVCRTATQGLQ